MFFRSENTYRIQSCNSISCPILTCDHGSVVFSTGDVSDAAVRKVLQWFWQINFKQKCPMAQLTVLTPAERVDGLFWHSKTDTEKQTTLIYSGTVIKYNLKVHLFYFSVSILHYFIFTIFQRDVTL